MIRDITRTLTPDFPAWPGDARYAAEMSAAGAPGGLVRVSRLTASAHSGTHIDAPSHVMEAGETIDRLALDRLVGPALVLHLPIARAIEPEDLPVDVAGTGGSRRILLRTESAESRTGPPRRWATLSPRAAEMLVLSGVQLVGIDTPSIDAAEDESLPAHRSLSSAGVAILEWLDLRGVAPGLYWLLALPLKLGGLEASPARALLLDEIPPL